MATGGEVPGHHLDGAGSEDLQQLKCQPCLEDGDLQEAVGMCVDCQDYLCLKCYQGHTLPKPMRSHQLLDREQMMQGQIRLSPKDACSEKCTVHDDEVIKYYCTSHSQLGCSVCITLDHTTCKAVQYIPQVAKDLASNQEYKHVESQLKSSLKIFQIVSENTKRISEQCAANSNEAIKKIKEHRQIVVATFDYIVTNLVEKTQAMTSAEVRKLEAICDKYKIAQEELQSSLTKIETLENVRQHCSSYMEMMRTKGKLNVLDAQIKEAEIHKSCRHDQVKFTPNLDMFDTLKMLDSFGTVSLSFTGTIESVKHTKDINVKSSTDTKVCGITGSLILTDGLLMLADSNNNNLKTVNVENGQIISQLKLSTAPWDITAISQNKVAVTMPYESNVAIVTVGDRNLSIDKTLTVNENCYGIDYRNDKLAVSTSSNKVQVLNLQGTVLYEITADTQGKSLFNFSLYLTFGQDDTTLYVSNFKSHNVVCVKLDGTVVATYTDSNLQNPRKPVVDSRGNVYVCAQSSGSVHQISKDCEKLRVLLTNADSVLNPCSICLNKEEDRLYVCTYYNNCVNVYERVHKSICDI